MFEKTYVGKNLKDYEDSDELTGYSRVVIEVSDELSYEAGTDTGRTLTVSTPWGTLKMAEDILARVRGSIYKPYKATGAILDPAAELGDGVSIHNEYGGLYSMETRFGGLITADISAPGVEEIDEETPYKSYTDRKIRRQSLEMRATFRVQAGQIAAEVEERMAQAEQFEAQFQVQSRQIAAKVSKTGGDPSSFGWVLDDSSWTIKANNTDVLRATRNGLEVYGKITATSGKIGGFDINSNYLSYNNQTWGGTNTTGLYLGVNGFQLGRNCKINMQGHAELSSADIRGTLRAGDLIYGGDAGYLSGSGLESHTVSGNRLQYNTVSTAYTSSGINSSLGSADYAYGAVNGWNDANFGSNRLYMDGHKLIRKTLNIEPYGYINIVSWQ